WLREHTCHFKQLPHLCFRIPAGTPSRTTGGLLTQTPRWHNTHSKHNYSWLACILEWCPKNALRKVRTPYYHLTYTYYHVVHVRCPSRSALHSRDAIAALSDAQPKGCLGVLVFL